jgi:transposase
MIRPDAPNAQPALLMNSAYQDNVKHDQTRALGFTAVVLLSPQLHQPRPLDRMRYRRRNEVERLFRSLEASRRLFTRFDKTNFMFAACVTAALIVEALQLR